MFEEFDRLSGMTFAVDFYSNKKVFVPRSKSTAEPRCRQIFLI